MEEGLGQLAEGAVFAGDYRIVRPLASGGMGAVYVAHQISTGKDRALKLMRPELAASAELRKRFELEARVGAKIDSAHVVEVQSAGVEAGSGTPYLVMELLDGEDLMTRVRDKGPLDVGEVRELFEQLCHAVAAAHAAGIVHRDLKPENVFLGRSKRAGGGRFEVKVLDFGIAKLMAESASQNKTTGLVGTPMWMAPEQTDPGPVTPAADVWALGLIVYFALTGRSYWLAANDPEATVTQLLKEIVVGELPLASARAAQQGCEGRIPESLDPVLGRAQARKPSKRYPDAAALWDALASALSGVRSSARVAVAGPADAFGRTQVAPTENLGLHNARIAADESAKPAPRPSGTHVPAGIFIPPAPREKALLHAEPTPAWMKIAGGVVGVVVLLLFVVGRMIASRAEPEEHRAEPVEPVVLGPAGSARTPTCRLCTTHVNAKGPLTDVEINRAIGGGLVHLDTECVPHMPKRGPRPRPGSVTLAFTVAGGRATNRRVTSTTSTDGTDQCFERSIADLSFPVNEVPTTVDVTLAYNPASPAAH